MDREQRLEFRAQRKLHGDLTRQEWRGGQVIVLRPDTFMNHSGQAVRAVVDYYSIAAERILVAYDDLDLPPGTIRLKQGGGHGGHNGLRSIVQHLGHPDFWRIRIGIGHPGTREAVLPWVLGRASQPDEQAITDSIQRAIAVLPELLAGDTRSAQQSLHSVVQG